MNPFANPQLSTIRAPSAGSEKLEIALVSDHRDQEAGRKSHLLLVMVVLLRCGFALAGQGADTRPIQDYLGHRNI
jgi:hypothetical protein